jgi:hypothetical protein
MTNVNDDFNEYFDDVELGVQPEGSNGNGAEEHGNGEDPPFTITPTDAMMALASAIENLTESLHRMFPQSAPPVVPEVQEVKEIADPPLDVPAEVVAKD